MKSIVDKISKLLMEEWHNYLIAFEENKDRMPTQLYRQFTFTHLRKYVTSYAMLKILPQVKLLKEKELKDEALELCTGSFTCSLGLPCVHTIERQNLANEPLKLEDVNQYWHFYKPRPTQSNSSEARWEDWPDNLPQKRNFQYVEHKKAPSLEPVILPPEELDHKRFRQWHRKNPNLSKKSIS